MSGYSYEAKDGKLSIRQRVERVCDALDALHREAYDQWLLISELEDAGISTARPYWMRRNDPDGKPDQLELTHPTGSAYHVRTGRRREYIGIDPDRIAHALASIDRYESHARLTASYNATVQKIRLLEGKIGMLETVALGRQQELWDTTAPTRNGSGR